MKSKFSSRIAAAGATLALAAGTVLVASPAAEAKPASVTGGFTCQSDFGPQSFDIKSTVDVPAKVKKNKTVAGKGYVLTASIAPGTADLLRSFEIQFISITASAVKFSVGSTKVAVTGVKSAPTAVPASGGFKVVARGKAAAFKIAKPGKYVVKAPSRFTFNLFTHPDAATAGTPLLAGLACVGDKGEPTKIGTLTVTK